MTSLYTFARLIEYRTVQTISFSFSSSTRDDANTKRDAWSRLAWMQLY